MENFYKWEIFLLETLKPPKKEKNKKNINPLKFFHYSAIKEIGIA